MVLVDGSLSVCFLLLLFFNILLAKRIYWQTMSIPHFDGGNLLMRSLEFTGVDLNPALVLSSGPLSRHVTSLSLSFPFYKMKITQSCKYFLSCQARTGGLVQGQVEE